MISDIVSLKRYDDFERTLYPKNATIPSTDVGPVTCEDVHESVIVSVKL